MESVKYFKITTALALGGTLFAGYLSGVKLFTDTCAFNEPCPYFMGYPACWYGFAMFATLLISAAGGLSKTIAELKAVRALTAVSALGIIFAGYFVVIEIIGWLSYGFGQGYGLGLPTCVYGLVFYIAIFALSLPRLKKA